MPQNMRSLEHCEEGVRLANMSGVTLDNIHVEGLKGPLVSMVNVTGTGLEGAAAIPPPVDHQPGNSMGR